jgi:hypothetical protein
MRGPEPILNPTTYLSPSGEYSLFINPDHRYGNGSASYRLTRQDTVVWEGKRPFTLWKAGVTDEGVVAGYGYSAGESGYESNTNEPGDYGYFEIVILNPVGDLQLHQKVKRNASPFLMFDADPNPLAEALLIDSTNDRVLIRLADADWNRREKLEFWWAYRLSTGENDLRPLPHPQSLYQPTSPVPRADPPIFNPPYVCLFGECLTLIDPQIQQEATSEAFFQECERHEELLKRLERRPDGNWLEWILSSDEATDGTLAVLDAGQNSSVRGRFFVSLYSTNDTPICTIALPSNTRAYPEVAFDGKHVIVLDYRHILCYSPTGEPLWQTYLAHDALYPTLTNDGKTLCLRYEGDKLYRYAMPEPDRT